MSSSWSAAVDALIWAGATCIIVLPVLLCLARPARKALNSFVAEHTVDYDDRAAKLQDQLVGLEERRHELVIKQGTLPEQIEATKAQLRAQTAQYKTDAIAAENTVPAATQALEGVIAARAQAEIDLAPDFVRGQWPTHDLKALGEAYKAYCKHVPDYEFPKSFGVWTSGFKGLGN